jgi:hypothetical protein
LDFQTEALQQQVTVNTEELKGTEVQVTELRRTYQNLEIELQSHLSMVTHLTSIAQSRVCLLSTCVRNSGKQRPIRSYLSPCKDNRKTGWTSNDN